MVQRVKKSATYILKDLKRRRGGGGDADLRPYKIFPSISLFTKICGKYIFLPIRVRQVHPPPLSGDAPICILYKQIKILKIMILYKRNMHMKIKHNGING